MRSEGEAEGCLATELQAIMGLCEARDRPQNAKQSVTERLCQYYIMHTKLYNVYYIKCLQQAIFKKRNDGYFEFFPGFL